MWGETNGKEREVLVNTSTAAWTYTKTEEKERAENLPLTSGWTASMKVMKQIYANEEKTLDKLFKKRKDIKIETERKLVQFLVGKWT